MNTAKLVRILTEKGLSPQDIADVVEALEKPTPKPKRTAVALAHSEPFEVWWTIYPRKVAKDEARKAWRQMTSDINALGLEELFARARLYADHVLGKDGEHIAHGATWLRGRRWNDELTPRGGQTDGNRRATTDHSAERYARKYEAVKSGLAEALDGGRRQRWRL